MKHIYFTFLFFLFSCVLKSADYIAYDSAEVRLLNKFTGKYEKIIIKANVLYIFDSRLYLLLRKCYKSSQEDDIENISFIQIVKRSSNLDSSDPYIKDLEIPTKLKIPKIPGYKDYFIFSGWLYSSSSSLNFLIDSAYDVTLIRCIIK